MKGLCSVGSVLASLTIDLFPSIGTPMRSFSFAHTHTHIFAQKKKISYSTQTRTIPLLLTQFQPYPSHPSSITTPYICSNRPIHLFFEKPLHNRPWLCILLMC